MAEIPTEQEENESLLVILIELGLDGFDEGEPMPAISIEWPDPDPTQDDEEASMQEPTDGGVAPP